MRTAFDFHRHKEKSILQCCKSWVVLSRRGLLGYEYMLSPHLCKSNYCEVCRKKNLINRRKQLYEILKGERWRMLELTFKDHAADKTEQFIRAHGMLKKLVQRFRRRYVNLKYARVFEVHKSGFPHVHFITNQYIPVAYARQAWNELGGGHVSIHEPKCTKCGGSLPCVVHDQKNIFRPKVRPGI